MPTTLFGIGITFAGAISTTSYVPILDPKVPPFPFSPPAVPVLTNFVSAGIVISPTPLNAGFPDFTTVVYVYDPHTEVDGRRLSFLL